MTEYELNNQVADTICRTFAWNGTAFKQGELVALLDGQIVAVRKTPDEAIKALRALDADPTRGMVIIVTPPVVELIC
jgi:hypothetical protein